MDISFGDWLTRQLKLRDMTQSDLAAKMETRPSSVSNWVRGKRRPKTEACVRIANALSLPTMVVQEAAGYEVDESTSITPQEREVVAVWRQLQDRDQDVMMEAMQIIARRFPRDDEEE